MPVEIAVVGSGPAGCYAAERLARLVPDAAIDVIDRLPTPYGLIRYGVAADHQSTKSVARVLDRLFERGPARFVGGVTVGRDVALAELRDLYDAVVVATGATEDRRLGIPGESLPGVVGSAAFALWANGAPDRPPPPLAGARAAVVIGAGNVALDVVRILAKTSAERSGSDFPAGVEAALDSARLATIEILVRRGPAEVKFSVKELAELGDLAAAQPEVDPADLPPGAADDPGPLGVLARFAAAPRRDAACRIRFRFHAAPAACLGADQPDGGRLARVRLAGDDGAEIAADLAVACIGFASAPLDGLELVDGRVANDAGRVVPGLYVAGWAKRGPSGTIALNRSDSHAVADRLAAELTAKGGGGAALRALLADRGVAIVDWAGWRRIDAAERLAARPDRAREKLVEPAALAAAARAP